MRTIDQQRPLTPADREQIHRAIASLIPKHGPEFLCRQPILLTDDRFDAVDFETTNGPVALVAVLLAGVDVGLHTIEFKAEPYARHFDGFSAVDGHATLRISTVELGEDIPGWVAECVLTLANLRAWVELGRVPTDAELLAYALLSGYGALMLSGATRVRTSGDVFHLRTEQRISGPWESSTWAYALAAQLSLRKSGLSWFDAIRGTTPSREARPLFEAAWGRPDRMALLAYFQGVDAEWQVPAPELALIEVPEHVIETARLERNVGMPALAHGQDHTANTVLSAAAGAGVGLSCLLFIKAIPLFALVGVGAVIGAAVYVKRARTVWRCSECVSELGVDAQTCPGCGANVYAFVRTGKETKAARLAMLDVPISWASPLVADA
ncbi:MAG: hypothetical protein ACI81R_003820, partial [Bradymonadia bacterium]